MIKGKYTFYEDGQKVAEFDNILTTYGKTQVPSMIAGAGGYISSLTVGCVETSAGVGDETLKLPLATMPVSFATPLYSAGASKVVYKARIPERVSGVISEVGALATNSTSGAIVTFGELEDVTTSGTVTTINGKAADAASVNDIRIGGQGRNCATSAYVTSFTPVSIFGALSSDTIVLGAYSTTTGASSVQVIFTDSNGYTATGSFSLPAGTVGAYRNVDLAISAFSLSNAAFAWSNIISTRGTAVTAGAVIDGLSFRSKTVSGTLLSRAIYAPALVKRAGSRMDIEYELGLNLA